MEKTDGLSRRLDWKTGMEKYNKNQKLRKEEWIWEMVVERPETEIVEKIKRAKEKDKKVVKVVEEMKRAEVKNLRGDEWKIEGDLVLKEEKVYILKDKELRVEII